MKADLDDLLAFEKKLGIDHVALTAISVYGNDNRLLLDRLRKLEGRGRGVVSIDPEKVTDQELNEMHAIGVRGARINLKSTGTSLHTETMIKLLKSHARRLRPLGWTLHLHIEMVELIKIHDVIPNLGVDVVLDHMCTPARNDDPRHQKGYNWMMDLIVKPQVYVKLSGLYRFNNQMSGLERYIKKVLEVAPTQVIWASDWPHTKGAKLNPDHDRKKHQEYRTVDVPAFIEDCFTWCEGDETLMHKILVDNPRRLWKYED